MSEGKGGRSKREERIGVERGEKGEKMRYIYIHTYIHTERQTHIYTDRQTDKQTDRDNVRVLCLFCYFSSSSQNDLQAPPPSQPSNYLSLPLSFFLSLFHLFIFFFLSFFLSFILSFFPYLPPPIHHLPTPLSSLFLLFKNFLQHLTV